MAEELLLARSATRQTGAGTTKKDNVNSIDSWVLEADQQNEDLQNAIGSLEVGGGLGSGLFEDDGYLSLAMLCHECSDDAAEDEYDDDKNNDDDDDAADAPGYAEFADKFVRTSVAEQGAFLWEME